MVISESEDQLNRQLFSHFLFSLFIHFNVHAAADLSSEVNEKSLRDIADIEINTHIIKRSVTLLHDMRFHILNI